MDETPVDYVAAALVYLLYDDISARSHNTDESYTDLLNKRYNADLPVEAVSCALTVLVSEKLLNVISSRFAPQYYAPVAEFPVNVAGWRFAKESHAARVLDEFMNGPPMWMEQALNSVRFKSALDNQLVPLELDEEPVSRPVLSKLVFDKDRLVGEVEQVKDRLDDAKISNAEKAQARAYLTAIQALAEAPDPPVILIWELVQRANNIAGIASLLVSLVALFVSH